VNEPVFLTVAQVKWLHNKTIQVFGGASGIRDTSLFEGAVIHPQQFFYYTQADLFEVAAAYAYHIAQAQSCFDGNKRTGVAAALLFLDLNKVSIKFDSIPLYEAMIAVAEKRMDQRQLATLFRKLGKEN
jgi:death-on-curing protein